MENSSTSTASSVPLPTQQVHQPVPEPKPPNYREWVVRGGAVIGGGVTGAAALHGITAKQREAVEIDNKTKDELTKQAFDAHYPVSLTVDSMQRRKYPEKTILHQLHVAKRIDDPDNHQIIGQEVVSKPKSVVGMSTSEPVSDTKNLSNSKFASLSAQQPLQTHGVSPDLVGANQVPNTSLNLNVFEIGSIVLWTIAGSITGFLFAQFLYDRWDDNRSSRSFNSRKPSDIYNISGNDVFKRSARSASLSLNSKDYIKIAILVRNDKLFRAGELTEAEFSEILKQSYNLSDKEIKMFMNHN